MKNLYLVTVNCRRRQNPGEFSNQDFHIVSDPNSIEETWVENYGDFYDMKHFTNKVFVKSLNVEFRDEAD